jgi:hypothetical protein
LICERSRSLIEGKLVAAGHCDPWDTLSLRSWLNAGEAILLDVVGDRARAALVAIGGIDNDEAVSTAVDMFYAAVNADQLKHKNPVETPVIPNGISDEAAAAMVAQQAQQEFVDVFLWTVQRNAVDHEHGYDIGFDDCDVCYQETVDRMPPAAHQV